MAGQQQETPEQLMERIRATYGTPAPVSNQPQGAGTAPAGKPAAGLQAPAVKGQPQGAGATTYGAPAAVTTPRVPGALANYANGGQVGMQTGTPPQAPAQGFTNFYPQQSFASGGQVGITPQGAPQQGGTSMLDPQQADSDISKVLSMPGAKEKIQQAVQQAVQSGQIDLNEAHKAVQLCKAAVQNPALWPQLRQFAIQQGLCSPTDLPGQYDPKIVLIVLTAAKAAEGMLQGGQGQQQGGIQPPPGMGPNSGGQLQGPGTGTSDSIPATNLANGGQVNVSTGEYVIPADVVKAKGKDFFDGMVKKYHQPTGYKG